MLRDAVIFVLGTAAGCGLIMSFFLLPVWLHARARKRALRARMDGYETRWLH